MIQCWHPFLMQLKDGWPFQYPWLGEFQNFPMSPLPDFFLNMTKIFCKFLWNNRCPRLRLSLLYLPYDRGGKCPIIKLYYWADYLRTLKFYFSSNVPLAWKDIEYYHLKLPFPTYLYLDRPNRLQKTAANPIIKTMIGVWQKVKKKIGWLILSVLLQPNLGEMFILCLFSYLHRCWFSNMEQ